MLSSTKGDEAVKDDKKRPRKLQKRRSKAETGPNGYEVAAVNSMKSKG